MKKYRWLIIDFITLLAIVLIGLIFVIFGKWDWKWLSIFFIITYFFNTIFIIFSTCNNDDEKEKLSWIFFMIGVPLIGLAFFALFRIRRGKQMNYYEYQNQTKTFDINTFNSLKSENNLNYITAWQSNLVKKNFYYTNLKIFKHGYEAYKQLFNDIKKAKKYIHIEMYIIKESEIYEKLKALLFKKIKEGVEVKIIIDKFGSWKVPIDEFKHLRKNGIDLCFFNVPIYPYVRKTDNRRLHRKFFIIDGINVHFGGLNISDEYCSLDKKYGYWADLNFSANGLIVNDYETMFLYDWFIVTSRKLDINKYRDLNNNEIEKSNSTMLSFSENPEIETHHLEDSIDFWINNSYKKIRISTPYFIPTRKIYNSLLNALLRNVEVEIYIPGKPDKAFTYKGTLFYANKLSEHGAKIYVLENIFLHAKFGTFDDKFAYIGTNNTDMRSLYTNHENINLLFGDSTIEMLNEVFDEYKGLSKLKEHKKFNFIKTSIYNLIFNVTAPLM